MEMSIAVLVNEKGDLTDIDECARIFIYQKTKEEWLKVRDLDTQIDPSDAQTLRSSIRSLIDRIDSKIVLSLKMSGIPYHMFDKYGFHIFESHKFTVSLLDGIIEEINCDQQERKFLTDLPKQPVSQNDDGNYYLNLIELQKTFPEISSKAALQKFMNDAIFYELQLICNHLPPWMESVMAQKNMKYSIEKINEDSLKVIIRKKGCEEL